MRGIQVFVGDRLIEEVDKVVARRMVKSGEYAWGAAGRIVRVKHQRSEFGNSERRRIEAICKMLNARECLGGLMNQP